MEFDSDDFIRQTYFSGELGCLYSAGGCTFRVWAPLAESATLRLYHTWEAASPERTLPMTKGEKGVWSLQLPGDLAGWYYTYETVHFGKPGGEAVDPYGRAVGPNGRRTYIFYPSATQPAGWETDRIPPFAHPCDAVIYELHVRDLSSLASSGIKAKGQFLGLAEAGTRSPEGEKTGLDHLEELGITHLHLLPISDYDEVDDLHYRPEEYNWGYNPRNYNALKGSYGSNPRQPDQVIRDFKTAVKALHDKGIRVVMDVVYNHTYSTTDSNLNKIFPDFYYRKHGTVFSNGSGCGNEIASERPMVRKMILDSLKYLASEYHLSGFRFDLMALHDVDTMNQVVQELRRADPAFLLYGEGWTGGLSTLSDDRKCLKVNAHKVREFAFFSDDTRDAIKGHVFELHRKGFVNGGDGMEESVKFSVVGNTWHPQVDYTNLLYSHAAWASAPFQHVAYAAAHDNHTLWDKLQHSNPHDKPDDIIKMHKLANTIVFTCQGLTFLHAGEDFLRSKKGVENSYNSPDSINGIDWTAKHAHRDVFEYYKGLIALRRAHPAFRMRSQDQVQKHLRFLNLMEPRMLAFLLSDHANDDPSEKILVIYNAYPRARDVHLPHADWTILLNHEKAGTTPLGKPRNNMVTLPARSAMVLVTDL